MGTFKKVLFSAVTVLGIAVSAPSNAVTVVEFDDARFSVNAVGSGTSYVFTYTANFTAVTGSNSVWSNGYAAGVSLDFGNSQLGAGSGLASTTAGGTWSYFQDKLNANGCTDITGSAICATETGFNSGALSLLNGNTYTWTFNVNFVNAAAVTAFFSVDHNLKFLATDGTVNTSNQGVKTWAKQGDLVSEDVTVTCCRIPDQPVPEPGTLALLGLGLLGLGLSRRRQAA